MGLPGEKGQLFPQIRHLSGGDKAQVPALQAARRQLRQIPQRPHPAAEPGLHCRRQGRVGPAGAAVEEDPPDAAVLLKVQKALDHRQHGKGRPLGVRHQHRRRVQRPGRLPGAGGGGGESGAVIVAHDALNDGDVPVRAVFRQQQPHGVL